MADIAFGLRLIPRPSGAEDMADERETVKNARQFDATDSMSDNESTTSSSPSSSDHADGLVPDQRKSILNRMAVVRYFSEPSLTPTLFDALPDPTLPQGQKLPMALPTPPADERVPEARSKSFDVLLKLDVTHGCGGRIWPAAERLGAYIAARADSLDWRGKSVVELGAGTGLLGFLVARLGLGANVWVTDLQAMLPLIQENADLNSDGSDPVHVNELVWGEPLPVSSVPSKPDVLLLADCVYLEIAFQPLVDTLYDLTYTHGQGKPQEILFCYQKRRKADKKFFTLAKRKFDIVPVEDDEPTRSEMYRRQGTHLMRLHRRAGR